MSGTFRSFSIESRLTLYRREEKFYTGGTSTIDSFTGPSNSDSQSLPELYIYDPYPGYNSAEEKWKGRVQACVGPHGRRLNRRSAGDMLLAYPGVQDGMS